MHLERAVRVVEDPGAADRADRAKDPLPVLGAERVDGELAHPLALGAGAGDEIDALQATPWLGDRGREPAERLVARVELDADRDWELGADGTHGAGGS